MRNAHRILVGRAEGKRALGGRGVDGNILLRWILKEQGVRKWI
jgi:hypothetical protein